MQLDTPAPQTTTAPPTDAGAENRQFSTFFLGGLHFGIEVLKVQEVIRYQKMTQVPLAAAEVQGLINLRGQIVTAIDLRRRIGLPDRPDDSLPMNVVVRVDDGVVSLLVDEIGDVLEVEETQFEQAPETVTGKAKELINGVYKLDGHLLLVLDIARAVTVGAGASHNARK